MVGYNKEDTITVNQKLLIGCFSGCLTRFLTQPLDVIKVRVQLQKKQKKMHKIGSLLRTIIKEEGASALWDGHTLGQIHSMISVGTQFYIYELLSRYVVQHDYHKSKHGYLINYACGSVAGCTSCVIVSPLEVIRTRQMLVKQQYQNLISGARAVYRSGGFRAYYYGLNATLMQVGPSSGASFAMFNLVQTWLLHHMSSPNPIDPRAPKQKNVHDPQTILICSVISGSAAGIFSKTLVYPLDLAKRRLQMKSHVEDQSMKTPSSTRGLESCIGLLQCLKEAYSQSGFWGLYRGWTITMLKAQFTSIIAFTSYELTCYAIREM